MSLRQLRIDHPPLDGHRIILVTEVTQMNPGLCVAGWDVHENRMVRPLPPATHNWPEVNYRDGLIVPGAIMRVPLQNPQPHAEFPHASEDLRASGVTTCLGGVPANNLFATLSETCFNTIDAIFGGNLVDRRYVVELIECPSLGGIILPAASVRPVPSERGMRAYVTDASRMIHDLKITDVRIRDEEKAIGSAAAVRSLQARLAAVGGGSVILRIGLARAWDGSTHQWDPKRCYTQLNGIIFP